MSVKSLSSCHERDLSIFGMRYCVFVSHKFTKVIWEIFIYQKLKYLLEGALVVSNIIIRDNTEY